MSIHFDQSTGIFHLKSLNTSYVFKVTPEKDLIHLYWGKRLRNPNVSHLYRPCMRGFSPSSHPENIDLSYDTLPVEYPFHGNGDFRSPSFQIQYENGSEVTRLQYTDHTITAGKPLLSGLPATYTEESSEAETLVIKLRDEISMLEVSLSYTVFTDYDAICRSASFTNGSQQPIRLKKAMSCSIDFFHSDFEMLQLSGSWIRERHVHLNRLRPGHQSIESKRGVSSHMQNPFFALKRPETTEDHGDVYGFSLVYSGNFLAEVEVDPFSMTRACIGINPFRFEWDLQPGDSFQTPESVLIYSNGGLNGLSQRFHKLYRERLCRGTYRDQERPILINNWEATYFDFNETTLLEIAKTAKEVGIELFVLDDGWFGKRSEDNCSLGDWTDDLTKLPRGLKGLSDKIETMGLTFGIWVEPEMVSADSDLYRSHPDWCLHVPDRQRTESRNQLVLDLSRTEVCDWLTATLKRVFSSAAISYVKWDMNRNLTEVWSVSCPPDRQGEVFHRYVLGLYRVLEELVGEFPDILFESCSGGGGRFDPGMLYYMPQTWTSDNTDAIERLKIQYGTSLVYPPISMAAHVSTIPNHQVQRNTPLLTRLHTAMSGNLGFELDLSSLNDQEKEMVKANIKTYKKIRSLIQFGDFYRIKSPFNSNLTAWTVVSEDKAQAALFYCQILSEPHAPQEVIRLAGLDADLDYRLLNYDPLFETLGYDEVYQGDALLYGGFRVSPLIGDFQSALLLFQAV